MAFYSEKDQKRIGAALTALRSVELRSESLNEVISVLSGENNTVNAAVDDNWFFDKSEVYECLANLIRGLDQVVDSQVDFLNRLDKVEELAEDAYDTASRAHADVEFPDSESAYDLRVVHIYDEAKPERKWWKFW